MRHGTTNRRQRGRGGNGNQQQRRGGQQRMQVFDSNGPDVRIRGTAHQVTEKYLTLAKDAASIGDRMLSENYLQHAEHYQRIINSWVQEETSKPENKQADGNQASKQEDQPQKQEVKVTADADLGLPASILGESAEVESKERTAETAA